MRNRSRRTLWLVLKALRTARIEHSIARIEHSAQGCCAGAMKARSRARDK